MVATTSTSTESKPNTSWWSGLASSGAAGTNGSVTADALRSSAESEDDSAVAPMDLCREYLERSLKRSFDDFEALEQGDAREFIPQEYLNPPTNWWECKVTRWDKMNFFMHVERPASEGGDKFLLSARRVGDDFYISQYESFPKECVAGVAPTGRFCAVVRKHANVLGHEFSLSPAACETDLISHISHSHFKQPECGADIRTVACTFPEPTSQMESKYVWEVPSGGGTVPSSISASSSLASGGARLMHAQSFSHSRRRSRSHNYMASAAPSGWETGSSAGSSDSSVDSSVADAVELANQLPVWDSVNGCLMMKFLRKRVRLSSSKNVVMFRAEDLMNEDGVNGTPAVDQGDAVYQFGKSSVKEDQSVFVLDFRNPVAPLQAFAMALSSFAFKTH